MSSTRILFLFISLWYSIDGDAKVESFSQIQNAEFQNEISLDTSAFASFRNQREFQYYNISTPSPGIMKIVLSFFRKIFGAIPLPDYLLELIIYIIAGSLLLLLIWLIIRNRLRSLLDKPPSKIPVSNIGFEILESRESLKLKLSKAADEGNFKLAVRYLFILLLFRLSEKSHIKADIYKTNRDYLNEINDQVLKRNYKELSLLYEYIWYGDFHIDKVRYLEIQQRFEETQKLMV